MKLISLALVASLAVAAFAYGQTASPAPAAAPAQAPASSSKTSISHDCEKEARKLCGVQAKFHSGEMQDCIKSNLDLGKFSAKCKTEFPQAAAKPKS